MFWLDCGGKYSNLSTFTRLTVDSISCLEFHTCEQVDQTSATWGSLSLEAPKIRSATRVGAFQECEMCPREASCLHQSLGSPKTWSSKLLTTWYLENRVVLQWQLYFARLSWKRVNQLMSIFIGPESDHWQCLSLTDWLTDSCLVDFIDVTLACEDANSKLVDAVTVADDDSVGKKLLPTRSSSATVTTSTSFELESSHARVTSIKFTKQESVSQWVS